MGLACIARHVIVIGSRFRFKNGGFKCMSMTWWDIYQALAVGAGARAAVGRGDVPTRRVVRAPGNAAVGAAARLPVG
jgi:hypothetical protein